MEALEQGDRQPDSPNPYPFLGDPVSMLIGRSLIRGSMSFDELVTSAEAERDRFEAAAQSEGFTILDRLGGPLRTKVRLSLSYLRSHQAVFWDQDIPWSSLQTEQIGFTETGKSDFEETLRVVTKLPKV